MHPASHVKSPEIVLLNSAPEHVDGLEALQRLAYPTLDESHLLLRPHLVNHQVIFPEGQHAALCEGRVVGMSATFRTRLDLDHPQHTFNDIIAEGYFSKHDPQGEWLYGADVSVHPDFRRLGLSRRFYDARKALIVSLGMRGMIAGGMIPGYRFHKHALSVEAYIQKVAGGELADPTLTPQLRSGFQVRGVLYGYLHDALLGDDAALIVWENPAWQASA